MPVSTAPNRFKVVEFELPLETTQPRLPKVHGNNLLEEAIWLMNVEAIFTCERDDIILSGSFDFDQQPAKSEEDTRRVIELITCCVRIL